jgi:hypothetical protein
VCKVVLPGRDWVGRAPAAAVGRKGAGLGQPRPCQEAVFTAAAVAPFSAASRVAQPIVASPGAAAAPGGFLPTTPS